MYAKIRSEMIEAVSFFDSLGRFGNVLSLPPSLLTGRFL
jgi:hypothetical protein